MNRFMREMRQTTEKGISVYEMAKRLGIPNQHLYRYEKDESARSIPPSVLARLRQISGLSWEQFGKIFDKYFLGGRDK